MSKTVCIIGICAFAFACGGSGATKTAQQSGADNQAAAQGNITVVGCLARADATPASVGTSGSATGAPPAGTAASAPAAGTDQFVLRPQTGSSPGSSSIAGTSGSLSYALDGDVEYLKSHVGRQVEAIGRVDSTASDTSSGQRLHVTSLRTIADTCPTP
jgi:hypothetical protein